MGGGRTAGRRLRDLARPPAGAEPRDGGRHQVVTSPSGTPHPGLRPDLPTEGGGQQAFRHLYVHVPFCKHKCGYCDFNAYAGMDRLMPDYVEALERELVFARERYPFQQLDTVYLGGGTPSLLPAELAGRLLRFIRTNFNVAPVAGETPEANSARPDGDMIPAGRAGGGTPLSAGLHGTDHRAQ